MARISINKDKIADFCRRHHIRRLGSVLRDDFGPASDVDVPVEFEPGHIPGLAFSRWKKSYLKSFGRKVDLNTSGFAKKRTPKNLASMPEFQNYMEIRLSAQR